jgi:hypothetical protein
MTDTYKVVRLYQKSLTKRTIKTGLTLEEAQAHCTHPETSSSTATSAAASRHTRLHGIWFDVYNKET